MELVEVARKAFEESIRVKREFIERYEEALLEVAREVARRIGNGGTVYFMGNGGSAADAAHLAAELVGRFYLERRPIRAVSLPSNDSILTEIPNDFGYDQIFSRQLEAFLRKEDVVIAISTSGNSKNIISGLEVARKRLSLRIGMTGRTGGDMLDRCDYLFKVDSTDVPRIQETHITLGHVLCQLIEAMVAEEK